MNCNKIAVIYAYYEKTNDYILNLKYFLKRGIYDECDYYFIVNGCCSIDFPKRNNIKVENRENNGYDFASFNYILFQKDLIFKNYDYYVFMNSSQRGPFIPNYIKIKWYEPFINMIKDDVKLVGVTINIFSKYLFSQGKLLEEKTNYKLPFPHVQSYFFVTDKECLKFLIEKEIFQEKYDYDNFDELIAFKEILMSKVVLENNWNISSIIPEYRELDYRTIKEDINKTSMNNDPLYKKCCFGRTIHPYEAIFIKTNREISVDEINSLTKYYYNSIV